MLALLTSSLIEESILSFTATHSSPPILQTEIEKRRYEAETPGRQIYKQSFGIHDPVKNGAQAEGFISISDHPDWLPGRKLANMLLRVGFSS